MTFEFWYMFPVSLVVATIAMSSGVGGAIFFSPIFMLILKLNPEVAIGTALITEVFGFASGLYGYARKKLIDYRLGGMLLLVAIPAGLLGTFVSGYIPPDMLKAIFGVGILSIAVSFLHTPDKLDIKAMNKAIVDKNKIEKPKTCLTSQEGEEICYTVCKKTEGMLTSTVGGFFMGMISSGLGEINSYFLLRSCKVPSKVSIATSVFVVAIVALTSSAGHFFHFVKSGTKTLDQVLSLVVFTIPGVIIGGQIGTRVSSLIPQNIIEKSLGILFLLVSTITLATVFIPH